LTGHDERPPAVRALLDRIREDAPVTRRDYLRILVTVSGGLLAGSVAIAAGLFPRRDRGAVTPKRIAGVIRPGEAVAFDDDDGEPAMAIRLASGELVGYSSVCTHLACAVLWQADDGKLVCPCHDGEFDPRTGAVVAGPPPRPLPRMVLEERAGGIWFTGQG
jgi:Rieske Fe-S protein